MQCEDHKNIESCPAAAIERASEGLRSRTEMTCWKGPEECYLRTEMSVSHVQK